MRKQTLQEAPYWIQAKNALDQKEARMSVITHTPYTISIQLEHKYYIDSKFPWQYEMFTLINPIIIIFASYIPDSHCRAHIERAVPL